MTYTLMHHGDLLEKEAATFVQIHLHNYQILWAAFIGNDGTNTMANMPSISNDLQIKRKLFSQHHYTVLESLYFMHLIAEDEKNSKGVSSFSDYRKTVNNLIAFFAYSGRLRDNVGKCFITLGDADKQKDAELKLNEFYYQRHIVVHGAKIPFRIDELSLFQIPQLRRDKSSNSGFDQSEDWNNISHKDLVFLSEAMSSLVSEVCPKVNALIGDMYELVKKILVRNSLTIQEPTKKHTDNSNQLGFSGNTEANTSSSSSDCT